MNRKEKKSYHVQYLNRNRRRDVPPLPGVRQIDGGWCVDLTDAELAKLGGQFESVVTVDIAGVSTIFLFNHQPNWRKVT